MEGRSAPYVITLLTAIVLAGCAGSGGKNERKGGGGGCEPPAEPMVSLATNIQPIFDDSCAVAGCHLTPNPAGPGLDLSSGRSRGQTVNVPSVERPKLDLITPGDPDASYLVHKIEGGPDIAGVLMPQGCPGTGANGAVCLTGDDIAAIRQWILECAPDN